MRQKLFSRSTILNGLFILLAIGALFLSVRIVGPEGMREWVNGAGTLGPVVFVLAKATTIVVAPLSGGFLYALAGTLFGFWKGVALVVIGDTIGGTIAFWISRLFGRAVVERMLGDETSALGRVLGAIGTVQGFLITRVTFVLSQDLMSYAAGLTRLAFLPFLIIHMGVGVVPSAVMTWLGSLIAEDVSGVGLGGIITGIGFVSGLSALALIWFVGKPLLPEKSAIPRSRESDQR